MMNTIEVANMNRDPALNPAQSRFSLFLNTAATLTNWINLSGAAIVVLTLGAMFLAVLANVILRYVFGSGVTWAYEIPSILFPWCIAGGLVMASAQGRNITVDMLAKVVPPFAQRVLAVAVNLFVSFVSAAVAYYSMPIIKASQYSRLAETGIPQIYGYSSLLYAFSMIAVLGLIAGIEYALGHRACVSEPTATNYS